MADEEKSCRNCELHKPHKNPKSPLIFCTYMKVNCGPKYAETGNCSKYKESE